jgi:hypothetical protein
MGAISSDITGTVGPEELQGELVQSPEYQLTFGDRARMHFFNDGTLVPDRCVSRYEQLIDEMRPGNHINSARWGGSAAGWENNQASMLNNYVALRSPIVLQQLRDAGLYPQIDAPDFNQYGGTVSNGFQLVMTASNQVYFALDGSDPRAVGGAITGTAYGGPIPITKNELVKARACTAGGTWSAMTAAFFAHESLSALRVSEIMPEPRGPTNLFAASAYEFIELFNSGTTSLDLEHVTITEGVSFAFPALTLLPGAFVVVAADTNAFAERYGTAGITLAGEYEGNLDNQGERVEVRSGTDGPVLSAFGYDNNRGWHIETEGGGHSLVPDLSFGQVDDELDHGANWRASTYRDGSPGAADPAPINDIVINEIDAHTDYSNATMPEFDSNDAIELFNNSDSTVNFTNWYLSDDVSDLTKWPIPPTFSLDAGDWLAFDEVTHFHNPTNTGFGLDKAGEVVLVSHLPGTAQDRIADAIEFKAQEQGISLGRYPDGIDAWFTMLPSTNAPNVLPLDRVVISEVMYHPSELLEDGAGINLEYVELLNATSSTVSLWNASGSWRLDGGVSFSFPTNVVIPAGSYLLIVGFDPGDTSLLTAFLDAYGDTNVPALVFGPLEGKLSNEGERIALEQPVAPDSPGEGVSWAIVDEIIYFDAAPWPSGADGSGVPLQRTSNGGDGNRAENWTATLTASPGRSRDKIGMNAPIVAETFFVPSPLPFAVIIDDQQIVGDLERIDFLVDGAVVGVVTQAPYTFTHAGITNPGTVLASSHVVDDGGTNASSEVPVEYVRLETLEPSLISDEAARLHGSLAGNGSAQVTFYWGKTDGETNAAAWDHSGTVGTVGAGSFLAEIGNLDAGSVYIARTFGQSGPNTGWSAGGQVFSTMAFNQWSNRMRISFPGYTWSNSLQDFAALVVLGTNIGNFSYNDFQPDASDLRFSTTNGTGLSYEIEEWNPLGASTLWVKVPTLSTQEQSILAYWGNANSVQSPSYVAAGGAWDDDYRTVWHAHGDFVDSTAAGIVGVINGASNATGLVSGALSFDGIDDYIDPRVFEDWFDQNIDGLTVSLWVKPGNANPGALFGAEDASGNNDLRITTLLGKLRYTVGDSILLANTIAADQWQLVTLVLDDYQAMAYYNDDPVQVIGSYTQFVPTVIPYVGMINQSAGSEFDGLIDEVRMSGVARSATWVGAMYGSIAMHDTFTSYEILTDIDPDFDKDGLPDGWERDFLGGEGVSDGSEDTDMDGLDDMGEYVAGTGPTNPLDVFDLYTGSSGGGVDLRFDMIPANGAYYVDLGRFYSLECAIGIASNLFVDIPEATNISAVAGPFIYTNFLGTTNPVRFYRGKVWLQSTN